MSTAKKYGSDPRVSVAQLVPSGAQRLLDVGCNTGSFGRGLKTSMPLEVWGVEPDLEAARIAEEFLDKVLAEPFTDTTDLPSDYFDVVSFNDVLEHFADPWAALRAARPKLKPGGIVIAAVPNVLHKSNLLHLLLERDFEYEETGIRDRTHLRFFTARSARRMFEQCGYQVDRVDWINPDWWPETLLGRLIYKLFSKSLEETKYIQFVISARVAG